MRRSEWNATSQASSLRARERFKFGELALRGRPAQAREPTQELQHLGGIARHLGGQRVLREAGEAGELRGLVPQREDFLDQRRVVPLRADPARRRA